MTDFLQERSILFHPVQDAHAKSRTGTPIAIEIENIVQEARDPIMLLSEEESVHFAENRMIKGQPSDIHNK